mgnify:FL=1
MLEREAEKLYNSSEDSPAPASPASLKPSSAEAGKSETLLEEKEETMRIYVAGAISSDPDYVKHFAAGKRAVRQAGYVPVLPPNLQPSGYDHKTFIEENQGATPMALLREFLKNDIACLLDCDGVALLPTWKQSTGARVEQGVARGVGLPVWEINEDYQSLKTVVANPITKAHPSSARFHQLLQEMGELHDRKQLDYGSDTDPFANVRSSSEWGLPAWVGAMVRATDKLRRLQSFARKGSLANESAIDSMMDLAVYSIIARILYESEESSGKEEAAT